ncbi:MAG: hypothetical protein ACXWFQ_01975, partial [Thermoanaerobaculia bacterium]
MSGRHSLAAAACAALFLPAASSSPPPAVRRVEVSRDFAVQRADGTITVEARPLEGETPIEFARRVSKDDATAQRLLALPGVRAGTRSAVLSYAALSDESKRAAIAALFPSDVRATSGWLHIAVEEERLAGIAEWFTGGAGNAPALARENALTLDVVPPGA